MVNKKIKKSVRFSQTKNDDDREDEVNVTIHVPVLPPRGGHEDSRFPLLLPNLLQHRQRQKRTTTSYCGGRRTNYVIYGNVVLTS